MGQGGEGAGWLLPWRHCGAFVGWARWRGAAVVAGGVVVGMGERARGLPPPRVSLYCIVRVRVVVRPRSGGCA